jgi:hypothetical protein
MTLKRTILLLAIVLLVAGVVSVAWWNADPERRWELFGNMEAPCPNCSAFIFRSLQRYSVDHEGWYPSQGTTSLDSLIPLIVDYEYPVAIMTNHAWGGDLTKHYEATHTISEQFCCYRYNAGLRFDDPEDLILMYFYRPTRWVRNDVKGNTVGRTVLSPSPSYWYWKFIPEEDFQTRQKKTEAFLEQRRKR